MKDSGLREWWRRAHTRVKDEFDRSLPLADYVIDRWERARTYGFGDGTSVYDSCLVLGDVVVGQNVWIGPFTVLDGSGGLAIGDGCAISAGVHVYSHDTVLRTVSGGKAPTRHAATTIGDNVFIGPNSVVQSGVTIGARAVVGACSFVNTDIPPDTLAFGSPCKTRGPAPRWPDGDDMEKQ